MTMNHGKHLLQVIKSPKDNDVGKSFDRTNSRRAIDFRKAERIRFNALDGPFDLVHELKSQTFSFGFIPISCIAKIFFCLEPKECCLFQSFRPNSSKTCAAEILDCGFASAASIRRSIRSRDACERGGNPSLLMLSQIFPTNWSRSSTESRRISGGTSI
jgi:hypothetical protein